MTTNSSFGMALEVKKKHRKDCYDSIYVSDKVWIVLNRDSDCVTNCESFTFVHSELEEMCKKPVKHYHERMYKWS